jgi:hypothetical protein
LLFLGKNIVNGHLLPQLLRQQRAKGQTNCNFEIQNNKAVVNSVSNNTDEE